MRIEQKTLSCFQKHESPFWHVYEQRLYFVSNFENMARQLNHNLKLKKLRNMNMIQSPTSAKHDSESVLSAVLSIRDHSPYIQMSDLVEKVPSKDSGARLCHGSASVVEPPTRSIHHNANGEKHAVVGNRLTFVTYPLAQRDLYWCRFAFRWTFS